MKRTATVISRTMKAGLHRMRPTRRHQARPGSSARRLGMGITGFTAALTLAVTLASPISPAMAVDYPSWDDLQNAKSNTAAAANQVTEIQNLIAGLQAEVTRTQAEAEARGLELQEAQEKFDDASRRATDLQTQADASKTEADAATRQAGQLAAQLYRTGGSDLSVNLFIDGQESGEGADELLSKLGSMSKLVERSTDVYEQAQTANNTAQSLGDQAAIAQAERETLRIAAEAAMAAAQEAAEAAAGALSESEAKSVELEAQLQFMQDAEATTAAAYQAGVIERARIAAEEAERARQAAIAAAAASAANSSSGAATGTAGAGLAGGQIGTQGWAVPAGGRITGGYGPRAVICSGGCSGSFHYGTDIGTGCSAPIYAAATGTVTYAGRYGTYGNFILISHGNGVETGYAHIRDGGIFVSVGQHVDVGQNIASSGTTGASTGCHLHFEVRTGGNRINAVPFMSDRGVPLG
ncbi:peptidoglycan DD-metalloendopeptidase family protein [Cryobacterium sp. SO2]|uniref:M23 family metallopeptidase n=1 Tax=Cryobacterium sp. SO2 TaxID=1897060 RepID=UPI00223E57B6|nr:M23 family metallopeptidase [Cryobacterium sp. SO2]WEO76912.1 peptidoglycan DD-metalloendopeptidase family protein [Cryobacterium sp. SO2]